MFSRSGEGGEDEVVDLVQADSFVFFAAVARKELASWSLSLAE
jgi:hypothetical protein